MVDYLSMIRELMQDMPQFAWIACDRKLRDYQIQVARAVILSVSRQLGDTIVVVFPRQSGKNELQAHIETYLLAMLQEQDAEIIKVSPTWKPQTQNAMRRLERVLKRCFFTSQVWQKEAGYIYRVKNARITFLSGSPTTSVVGATATHLLECDEAQDILPAKWDKEFAPMAAATNATRVFWGTAWTSHTLLARELRLARQREREAGRRLAFVLDAGEVRRQVPAYGSFVDEQVRRLGRDHPMVHSQFYSEEIDAETGMFPPRRTALMRGEHAALAGPRPGFVYCLLLDVAGEDEASLDGSLLSAYSQDPSSSAGRDSSALTVVEVDLSTLADELLKAPTYRVVSRYLWTGVRHHLLYGQIRALAEHWGARYLVVDATGVGAGLASFLDKALPGKVIPFVFSQKSKSDLGWGFLAVVETGRYKEYGAVRGEADASQTHLQQAFWTECAHCQYTILEGGGKSLRWGVPDGTRDPLSGELVHDDLLVSAAFTAVLDTQEWGLARSAVVRSVDPLEALGDAY